MKEQLAIACQLSRLARKHLQLGVDREGILVVVRMMVLTKRIDRVLTSLGV